MKHNFKYYCKDYTNIENYEMAAADNFKGWHCHHRLETHNSDGERREVDISMEELKSLNMYYNRPAEELIFLTTKEHNAFKKGRHHSAETKNKLSEVNKGKKLSEEAKMKISAANKGKQLSEETKKKMSEARKGRRHTEEARKKISDAAKGKHISEEHKKKIAEAARVNSIGRHWFNNGKENKFCYECPDGFVPGKLLIK